MRAWKSADLKTLTASKIYQGLPEGPLDWTIHAAASRIFAYYIHDYIVHLYESAHRRCSHFPLNYWRPHVQLNEGLRRRVTHKVFRRSVHLNRKTPAYRLEILRASPDLLEWSATSYRDPRAAAFRMTGGTRSVCDVPIDRLGYYAHSSRISSVLLARLFAGGVRLAVEHREPMGIEPMLVAEFRQPWPCSDM
jgi:hypothetical protein